jgi:tetraacyldisaccharide 4'-kinase
MVVIGHDRYEAGRVAERELHPDLFLLDDGFQHLRLQRDLNILLLDGRNPFGNGLTLPAGLLREPRSALGRADLVVLTRCAAAGVPPAGLPPGVPILRAGHRLVGVIPLPGGACRPFSELSGERVLAFAGIADPSGFFEALTSEGVDVVWTRAFPDHAGYGEAAIDELCRLRDDVGATCLVTTAKDAVKLEAYSERLGPVMVARLELELYDRTVLEQALRPFC